MECATKHKIQPLMSCDHRASFITIRSNPKPLSNQQTLQIPLLLAWLHPLSPSRLGHLGWPNQIAHCQATAARQIEVQDLEPGVGVGGCGHGGTERACPSPYLATWSGGSDFQQLILVATLIPSWEKWIIQYLLEFHIDENYMPVIQKA